ncbi:chitobiosyldiphosphodolichol beta-mannosyltransferase [Diaporthe helianthi]|uniref:Chitobiosyldiphosphodolichol beta-mannosyltransferase n=1 Tax=Diaporthe helianthi TaxID=158607 RepID=A0A2P5HVJ8_DIAHE|nr:chitobiosyldiphosphodolichol beta-mannosyltransferase [Diaporthe helianthi]
MELQVILLSLVGAVVLTLLVAVFLLSPTTYRPAAKRHVTAQVLVLGDIGRSPRMQYHALSIAKHGGTVELIGYHESALLPALTKLPNVTVCALGAPPALLRSKSAPFIITGPLKVLWQVFNLFHVLLYDTQPAQWLLVQNPPSIPTLAVAWLTCTARNTRLVIDWHNYGWTILEGTRGSSHPFVRISKLYECFFGRIAPSANLTVTRAMKRQLQKAPWGIRSPIVTMHDRPAAIFQPVASPSQRESYLSAVDEARDFAAAIAGGQQRLVVSSTSWTPDEDFGLLLDALVRYGAVSAAGSAQPPLLVIITGRGPQKTAHEAKIARLASEGKLHGITVRTAFLSFDNYARLLAAADLGICLHMSSSGVDLPMKVVDMFGAGLPVLAYSGYESFGELVKEGENGCGFETSAELGGAMSRLLVAEGQGELARLRDGAVREGRRRWDEEWDQVVKPLLGFSRDEGTHSQSSVSHSGA